MMIKTKNIKYVLILLTGVLFHFSIFGQSLVNNGANIIINNGAEVTVGKNLINQYDGSFSGEIQLDGVLIVQRDWINNAFTSAIVDINSNPNGKVILNGDSLQYIGGITPTDFRFLLLENSDKILEISNCNIYDTLQLAAPLVFNSNKMIIDNPSPNAIINMGGYLFTESDPFAGYGELQWNIGNNAASYEIPFGDGSTASANIPVTVSTYSSGQSANGHFLFSTYPTNCLNFMFPDGTDAPHWDGREVVDRYWIIDADYASRPNIDLILRYTDASVGLVCNNLLDESLLQGLRYDLISDSWFHHDPAGVTDVLNNTTYISGILGSELEKNWALSTTDTTDHIYWPTGFTPNGDGLNDRFGPVGTNLHLYTFDIMIFNRYGELIYYSKDIFEKWDGRVPGHNEIAPLGTYTYISNIIGKGKTRKYKGQITLIK